MSDILPTMFYETMKQLSLHMDHFFFFFFLGVVIVAFCVPKLMENYIILYKTLCFCRTEIWMLEFSTFEIHQS